MTTDAQAASPYRGYLNVWLSLLVITLIMVFLANPVVLLVGMLVKVSIIALWFMHLRSERIDFTWIVALSILLTGGILFALIAPDGLAM